MGDCEAQTIAVILKLNIPMRRSRLSLLCYTYSIHFEQSHIQNRGQFDKLQDKKYKVNGKNNIDYTSLNILIITGFDRIFQSVLR